MKIKKNYKVPEPLEERIEEEKYEYFNNLW
jgi:hypothetical protein